MTTDDLHYLATDAIDATTMTTTASTITSNFTVTNPSMTSAIITSSWGTPYQIPEEVARKLADIIEQLEHLDDPEELNARAAGIAQEAECSQKQAKTTLVALRALLSLAAIERKLEAV